MQDRLLTLTADVVAAYLTANPTPAGDVPELIRTTYGALAAAGQEPAPELEQPTPAANPRRSVRDDAIISLIDGKPYKMLKRHIGLHGYTPETYRAAFGLPPSYPMTAPAYARKRAELAKQIGLGRIGNPKRGRKPGAAARKRA